MGRAMSGYYVLHKGDSLEKNLVVSYCDMDKESFDSKMETALGKLNLEYESCPRTHPWALEGGTKCCRSPRRRQDPLLCPASSEAKNPVLGFADPVTCCVDSDTVPCPSPFGACSSDAGASIAFLFQYYSW